MLQLCAESIFPCGPFCADLEGCLWIPCLWHHCSCIYTRLYLHKISAIGSLSSVLTISDPLSGHEDLSLITTHWVNACKHMPRWELAVIRQNGLLSVPQKKNKNLTQVRSNLCGVACLKPFKDEELHCLACILAEGAIALSVTLSGGALFASWKLLQFLSSLTVKVILAIFMWASAQLIMLEMYYRQLCVVRCFSDFLISKILPAPIV